MCSLAAKEHIGALAEKEMRKMMLGQSGLHFTEGDLAVKRVTKFSLGVFNVLVGWGLVVAVLLISLTALTSAAYAEYPIVYLPFQGAKKCLQADHTGNIGHKGFAYDFELVYEPVYASKYGRVSRARNSKTLGLHIVIEHEDNYRTLYAHLSKMEVSEGQTVTTGQRIGISGNTGYSSGPHLHWSVFG